MQYMKQSNLQHNMLHDSFKQSKGQSPPYLGKSTPQNIDLNLVISQSPYKIQSLPNELNSDGNNLMNNQVFIHRVRQRNADDRLKSQDAEKGGFQVQKSPKKVSTKVSKNRDLEGMWSPPDMNKPPNLKFNDFSTNKNEQGYSLSRSPKSKSPLKRQLSSGSFKSTKSPRNITGPKDIPTQLQAVQALAGQFQITQGQGIGGLGLVRQPSSTFQSIPTKLTIPFASIKDLQSTGMSNQNQYVNPGIINVGSLSFFGDDSKKHARIDGCFPSRITGVNEQRFFKKGFTKESLKQQRAQTASAMRRNVHLKKQSQISENQDAGNEKEIWQEMKKSLAKQNEEKQKEGTIVIQATLNMSNQQFFHPVKQVKSMKNTLQDHEFPFVARQQSPESSHLRKSSELKVRRQEQHSNNPTLLQNRATLSPTNPTQASEVSFFKVQQISPRNNINRAPSDLSPDATLKLQRRYQDIPSSMNVASSLQIEKRGKLNLSREETVESKESRQKNGIIVEQNQGHRVNILAKTKKSFAQEIAKAYQSLPSGVIRHEEQESTPTAQLEVTVPAPQPGAASIANLSIKQQSHFQLGPQVGVSPDTIIHHTPSALPRSRSKSGSQIMMIEPPGYILGPATLQHSIGTDDTGNQNGVQLTTNQTPTLYMFPNSHEITVVHNNISSKQAAAAHSPGHQSQNRHRPSFEVGAISLPDMAQNGQQIKVIKLIQGNHLFNQDLGNIPSVTGQRVIMTHHQAHRPTSSNIDFKFDEKRYTFNSDNGMTFTGMIHQVDPQYFSSVQPTSFNSTMNFSNGINQTKDNFSGKVLYQTQRFKSQRTSTKESARPDRRKNIEFRILKMNLAQPPTSEKSNLMTCEVDLSSHIMNKYKTTQQGQPSVTLSQTLNLAVQNPKFIQSTTHLRGTSLHQHLAQTNINQDSTIKMINPTMPTKEIQRKTLDSQQKPKRDLNFFLQAGKDSRISDAKPNLHINNSGLDRNIVSAQQNQRNTQIIESGLQRGSQGFKSSEAPQSQISHNQLVQRPFVSSAAVHNKELLASQQISHQMSDPAFFQVKTLEPSHHIRQEIFSSDDFSAKGMQQNLGKNPLKSPGDEILMGMISSPPSLMSSAHQPQPFAVNVVQQQSATSKVTVGGEKPHTQRGSRLFRQSNPTLVMVNQMRKEAPSAQRQVPKLQLPTVVGLISE